jgi:hypothetical protein
MGLWIGRCDGMMVRNFHEEIPPHLAKIESIHGSLTPGLKCHTVYGARLRALDADGYGFGRFE